METVGRVWGAGSNQAFLDLCAMIENTTHCPEEKYSLPLIKEAAHTV